MSHFSGEDFSVIGFPSSNFANQEPGSNAEILKCLEFVRPGEGFKAAFPLMQKADVNGSQSRPVFKWLRESCYPSPSFELGGGVFRWSPVTVSDITWNFEKFLINKEGIPIKRYAPDVLPHTIVDDIRIELNK